jgi:hypothetical protein
MAHISEIEQFIKVDKDTGEVVIMRDTIVTYEVFNKILRRDRGSPGDAQGRDKKMFLKEFGYIYIVGDVNSYPHRQGFSEKRIRQWAVNTVRLPEDWKPDALIEEAITLINEMTFDPLKKAAYGIRKGLSNWVDLITKCNVVIENILDAPNMTLSQINELIAANKSLLDIAAVVPDQIKKLEAVISDLKDTPIDTVKGRGSVTITSSMMPEQSIG